MCTQPLCYNRWPTLTFFQNLATNEEDQPAAGHTNLAFEPTEIETAISKAKDLKTLTKNLDVDDANDDVNDDDDVRKSRSKKTSKKKRFQSTSETRINNDLKVDVHLGNASIDNSSVVFHVAILHLKIFCSCLDPDQW